ncbi:hypothetical protein M8818_004802 [Zalaria obscura]|uniref:Uncharacterized protein n=1 Tax=Zalaria obscura TaxID=2024903 RepID=A0ACC3SBK2_9PEZI
MSDSSSYWEMGGGWTSDDWGIGDPSTGAYRGLFECDYPTHRGGLGPYWARPVQAYRPEGPMMPRLDTGIRSMGYPGIGNRYPDTMCPANHFSYGANYDYYGEFTRPGEILRRCQQRERYENQGADWRPPWESLSGKWASLLTWLDLTGRCMSTAESTCLHLGRGVGKILRPWLG